MITSEQHCQSDRHEPGKHWPGVVREAARLLYASGRVSSLRELADKTGVPHDTLRRWCSQDQWGEIAAEADTKATQELADWLVLQRQEHWKNVVTRAGLLLEEFDRLMALGGPFSPSELRLLVVALDKADSILWRNLPATIQS